jgi:hypothetical protein
MDINEFVELIARRNLSKNILTLLVALVEFSNN